MHHDRPEILPTKRAILRGERGDDESDWQLALFKGQKWFLGLDTSMDVLKQAKFKNEKVLVEKKNYYVENPSRLSTFFGWNEPWVYDGSEFFLV